MAQIHKFNSYAPAGHAEIGDGSTSVALVRMGQYQQTVNNVATPAAGGGLVAEYSGLLGRHRSKLIACALIGAAAGFLITVGKLPVYRARTSLDIQNLNTNFMNMKEVAQTEGGDNSGSSDSYVQTQIKLLQSDTLRKRTVQRMMSGAAGEFITRNDLLSEAKAYLQLPGDRSVPKSVLIAEAAKNVVVKPLGATRLVEVTCDSWNAKFSAEFCNTLAAEFSAQDHEVRGNEAQATSEWLTRQLADVRESLAKSEKKLEETAGTDSMILHHGGDSISAEKLDQLQTELTKVQAERVAKQAQYEMSNSAAPDSLPMILDNSEFRDLQTKREDLRRQVAALVPPLTEENPKVQHLRAQIAEVESSLLAKKQDLVQRMKNEYDEAQHREALLSRGYLSQEKKVAVEQSREAQESMLRHEADSEQQVYQTLLQKVKEAGFASAMQASTVRVVDAAQAPEQPIGPRRTVSTFVGALLGIFAGLAAAFIKERTETTLRSPGESPRYLALRELGVIPSGRRLTELSPHGNSIKTRVLTMMGPSRATGDNRPNNLDMRMWKDHSSLVAEAFRGATYSILLASKQDENAKIYVISSPNISEGKTTVTCNLGFALAQANRRVLLIDGDLRKPRLHKSLGVTNKVGFQELLMGNIDLKTAPLLEYCQPTLTPNLSIITSGHGVEEPVSALYSPRCQEVLSHLTQHFDIILIDTPPVMHMADARILGGLAAGAILVFRSGVTDRETAANARDLFLNDRVKVLGTILNDFNPEKEGKGSYYRSYYAYSQSVDVANEPLLGKVG